MDIISIVNAMQPNTISCFALTANAFPNGGTGVPFMGGFAQLFPGATLPTEAQVTAYESTYNAALASAAETAAANAALPDIPTQLANLAVAVTALGGTLPTAQITAANNTLTAIGSTPISTTVATATLATP